MSKKTLKNISKGSYDEIQAQETMIPELLKSSIQETHFSNLDALAKKEIFEENEAEVRSYCRNFPVIFTRAVGARLRDTDGNDYIDFLAGAGVMNYGHNNRAIKKKILEYIQADGLVHSLDLYTTAKYDFIETLYEVILRPRKLDYKITFPGPTGTNAVETALKFARKGTGRQNVVAFTNAFHGMTQGSLSLTGNRSKREGSGTVLTGVFRAPYDGYFGKDFDSAAYLDKMLSDSSSGVDAPAAIIIETVQAEGGLNTASFEWLKLMDRIAHKHGAMLIIDDIQAGCGRTGTFFSFEGSGINPDIVCLSKSIGGMGLPMSLVLFRPDLDVLEPGQHNGTFRGNNLAFIAAKAALDLWRDPEFEKGIQASCATIFQRLEKIVKQYPMHGAHIRGRGMIIGIGWDDDTIASKVSKMAFQNRLIIETSGANDQVLKILPPLTISKPGLKSGLDRLEASIAEVVSSKKLSTSGLVV